MRLRTDIPAGLSMLGVAVPGAWLISPSVATEAHRLPDFEGLRVRSSSPSPEITRFSGDGGGSGTHPDVTRLIDEEVEKAMREKAPANEALRKTGGVIDQRRRQIDPAGNQRVDPYESARRSQKQPGQDPRDPQSRTDDGE